MNDFHPPLLYPLHWNGTGAICKSVPKIWMNSSLFLPYELGLSLFP